MMVNPFSCTPVTNATCATPFWYLNIARAPILGVVFPVKSIASMLSGISTPFSRAKVTHLQSGCGVSVGVTAKGVCGAGAANNSPARSRGKILLKARLDTRVQTSGGQTVYQTSKDKHTHRRVLSYQERGANAKNYCEQWRISCLEPGFFSDLHQTHDHCNDN